MTETARGTQVIHDLILDLVSDHPADCHLCVAAAAVPPKPKEQAGMSETTTSPTLTKSEHEAAVAAAVAQAVADATRPLAAELDALKAASKAAETDQRVADLQSELDTLIAEKAAAEKQIVAVAEYLAAVQADAEHAVEIAARRDARAAEVATLGLFPEDHIEAAKARWAELDDDAWAEKVGEYQAIAVAHKVAPKTETIAAVPGKTDAPVKSALTATAGTDKPEARAFSDVFGLRFQGVDLTTHVN